MKNFFRWFIFTAIVGFSIIALSQYVHAANIISPVCQNSNATEVPEMCKEDSTDNDNTTENPIYGPQGILTKAINILSFIIGIVAVFAIIVSGIRFVVSAGDSNAVASARNGIIYAVAGLAVVALAQTIVLFVLNRLE